MKRILLTIFLGLCSHAYATIYNAVSVAESDVSAEIALASDGDTVVIPAGTATWTSGIQVSKAIAIQGAGSGRIIAYDDGLEKLTVGTGTLNVKIAGYSPGFSGSFFTVGQTVRVFETNSRSNWMQGTVANYSGNTLTVNVTSTGGSGSTHRWLVSTLPLTTITNNSASAPLFTLTESTAGHIYLSGIQFVGGITSNANFIKLNNTTGGKAILIHDCWIEHNQVNYEAIDSNTSRGVIWKCSFDGSSGNPGQLVTTAAFRIKAPNLSSSWTTPSTWGSADTTGEGNFYVETCDFHTFQGSNDTDDNARLVWRYNLIDSCAFGTHGADGSPYGQRYFEYYNNTGVFHGYSDGSTFNMPTGWVGLVRGGTFVVHDNALPSLNSTDYPNFGDIMMIQMNLTRNIGVNPCWGKAAASGAFYPDPRQIGFGYVTGNGKDGQGRTKDSITYVGDREPAYIWSNGRTLAVSLRDYSPNQCSPSDFTASYAKSGRDYFNDTAKPNYTPYTYPHPLTQAILPSAPQNLKVVQ